MAAVTPTRGPRFSDGHATTAHTGSTSVQVIRIVEANATTARNGQNDRPPGSRSLTARYARPASDERDREVRKHSCIVAGTYSRHGQKVAITNTTTARRGASGRTRHIQAAEPAASSRRLKIGPEAVCQPRTRAMLPYRTGKTGPCGPKCVQDCLAGLPRSPRNNRHSSRPGQSWRSHPSSEIRHRPSGRSRRAWPPTGDARVIATTRTGIASRAATRRIRLSIEHRAIQVGRGGGEVGRSACCRLRPFLADTGTAGRSLIAEGTGLLTAGLRFYTAPDIAIRVLPMAGGTVRQEYTR